MRYPAAKAVLFAGVVLAGATAAASSVGRGVVAADLALVLAVDVSSSVTTERWELQRQGYAAAFRSSEVLHAIRSGPTGVIAVTMVQWSDMAHQQQTVPWRWDAHVRIAIALDIRCYEAGQEYEHGGLSPQECVTPLITVTVLGELLPTRQ